VQQNFVPIDAEAILTIKPSRDIITWLPEKNSVFTVRSAYKLAMEEELVQCSFATSSSRPDGRDECWKKIWRANVPPKVKTFAWKAAANALATEENNLRRHMHVTGMCKICCRECPFI
jgi:hypothetical protein